ncbi:MAG: hypothetical protein IJR70_09350 [Eubacterium sp.]|nr:hypothetical protein [Eubacterium sp.]MBR1763442.1 hypothetical protein [Eubacterium sp.]
MRGNVMDILEELWYGNITPTEYSRIENNTRYKEALRLVNQNQECLKATLTDEQNELLERLLTASEEFANLIELDCFKVGFKLGARFIIEAYT